jgi:hypothetical protein
VSTQVKSNEAIVRGVGPGEWYDGQRVPIGLKVDDRVLFLRSGYQMTLNGEKVYVVTDRQVLSVLDDDDVADFVGEGIDEQERKELLAGGPEVFGGQ